ncbi:MAG: nucleotidyltransferase family protein [Burkholderiales bacterium]|nr:nucleotidyltransferase family protein [Burkholderiales bacterium]
MQAPQPTVIVLGAGRGSRYRGSGHKLERRLGEHSLFGCTLGQVLATGLPVKVVTTEPLLPIVLPQVARRDVLVLPDPESDQRLGMGYSIATGVRSSLDAAGWLVLPADMPLVRSETILRLAQALPRHTLVYPQYQGRRGHPVGFSGELASELVRLTGDEGARRVVARYPGHAIDVEDAGVLQDFDTEDDFRQWDGQHADLC